MTRHTLYTGTCALVFALGLASCGFLGHKSSDDNSSSSPTPTNAPNSDNGSGNPSKPAPGTFTCGNTACKSGAEFCVTQRFTGGGAIVDNSCHTLPANCVDGDCAHSSLAAPLKDAKCGSYTDLTKGNDKVEITLNFVDPDLLPLANKVSDSVKNGTLTINFKSSQLTSKIAISKLFYIEDGQIKNDPTTDLHCSLSSASSGFLTPNADYQVSKINFRDSILLGTMRQMRFYLDNDSAGFECTRNNDVTPFVLSDLQKIFGTLATVSTQ